MKSSCGRHIRAFFRPIIIKTVIFPEKPSTSVKMYKPKVAFSQAMLLLCCTSSEILLINSALLVFVMFCSANDVMLLIIFSTDSDVVLLMMSSEKQKDTLKIALAVLSTEILISHTTQGTLCFYCIKSSNLMKFSPHDSNYRQRETLC